MSTPRTITLTGSDVTVPMLAIGTMYWGIDVSETDAHAMLDVAVEHGKPFVDTANNYAFWRDGGTGDESETVIGSWLATHDRDSITLATKVGARPGANPGDPVGLRPEAAAEQLRDSLRRLQTDHVDVLYAHIDDTAVPLGDVIGGLRQLVTDGLVRTVAASNLTADRLREAVAIGGYVGLQNRFSYLRPAPDTDLAPHVLLDDDVADVAADAGLALFGYSSLLGAAYTRDDRPLPDGYVGGAPLTTLREVAADHGLDTGQAVLAWMGQRSQPVVPVVGVSRREQLDSALDAVATVLDPGALDALDAAR